MVRREAREQGGKERRILRAGERAIGRAFDFRFAGTVETVPLQRRARKEDDPFHFGNGILEASTWRLEARNNENGTFEVLSRGKWGRGGLEVRRDIGQW